MHIELADELVAELDRVAGRRGRSAFVRTAVQRALENERRWEAIESAAGTVHGGHEWDADPARWVRDQRRGDARRGA
jgi:metal-responsive CopG/Arc/MetJ family transcriptional regulator